MQPPRQVMISSSRSYSVVFGSQVIIVLVIIMVSVVAVVALVFLAAIEALVLTVVLQCLDVSKA